MEKQLWHGLWHMERRVKKVPICFLTAQNLLLIFWEKDGVKLAYLTATRFCLPSWVQQPIFVGVTASWNMQCKSARQKIQKNLRSTKLRKHVATLCQLLDLDNQELEQVACFWTWHKSSLWLLSSNGQNLSGGQCWEAPLCNWTWSNTLDPVVFGMLILTITILILTMYFK